MNATVGRRMPRPASAIATGTMRTTVRLSAAYRTTCQVMCGIARVSASAPKPIQVTAATRPPASSVNSVTTEPRAPETRPKAMPPTNAAMKPLPPEQQRDRVGEQGDRQRDDLPPLAADPAAAVGDAEQQAAEDAGGQAGGQAPADLLGRVADDRPGHAGLELGVGDVERDEEEGHGEAVVEPALHVERLAHAGRHRRRRRRPSGRAPRRSRPASSRAGRRTRAPCRGRRARRPRPRRPS